jgi:hypothetical protein
MKNDRYWNIPVWFDRTHSHGRSAHGPTSVEVRSIVAEVELGSGGSPPLTGCADRSDVHGQVGVLRGSLRYRWATKRA